MEKQYLGDSVYVEFEGGMFKLTTENGYPDDPSNTICLEPEVFSALAQYVKNLQSNRRVFDDRRKYS